MRSRNWRRKMRSNKTSMNYKNLSPKTKLSTIGSKNNVKDWTDRRQFPLKLATAVMKELGEDATIAQVKVEIKKRAAAATV